eukprot:UN04104
MSQQLPINDHVHNQHVEFFLKEENTFIESYAKEFQAIKKWDSAMRSFLRARRDPTLLKLSQTYRSLKDQIQCCNDSVNIIQDLIKVHSQSVEKTKHIQMFNTKLLEEPNHLPTITATAQSDPSVIQLAALSNFLYSRSENEAELVNTLTDIVEKIKYLITPVALDNIFKLIKLYDIYEKECAEVLKEYSNVVDSNLRKRYDFKALTLKERNDVFVARQKYVKKLLKTWKLHMKIGRMVNEKVSILCKTTQTKKDFLQTYLNDVTKALLEFEKASITKLFTLQSQQAYSPYQSWIFNSKTGFFVSEEPLVQPTIPTVDTLCAPPSYQQSQQQQHSLPGTSLYRGSSNGSENIQLDKYGRPIAPEAPAIPDDWTALPFNNDNTDQNIDNNIQHQELHNPYELQLDDEMVTQKQQQQHLPQSSSSSTATTKAIAQPDLSTGYQYEPPSPHATTSTSWVYH